MAQQSLRFCEIILFKIGVFNLSNYSKRYSKEFKDSIVNLYNNENRSMISLSREYGMTVASIAKWVKDRKVISTEDGNITNAEFRALKKKLAQVEEKRDILKAAAVILGKK
jgi:transposase